ncbi:MAG: hypothetical protein HQL87_08830 [Magnetococcales bacterium]|nr:hypothetical protein [Magnetococcales bacterium]
MRIAIPDKTLAASTARLQAHFFAAAIFLCVTVLVGVAAAAQFLQEAVEVNARQLLAADLRLQAVVPIPPGEGSGSLPTQVQHFAEQRLSGVGRLLAPSLEFTAMARVGEAGRSALVEVKAVGGDYPVRGRVQLDQDMPLARALADGGVVVEKTLLTRLGLAIGDTLVLGEAVFTIRAALTYEPDRITHLFSLGPRVLMALDQVVSTGLLQAGSRVTQVVSVRLAAGEEGAVVARTLRAAAQAAGMRLLTPDQSQPSVKRFIRHFALFLALTALLTLLVGGLAMTHAMAAYLRESWQTLAILKLLGAETRQVVALVLWAVWRMVWPACLAGGVVGIVWPGWLPSLLAGLFPAEAVYHPSWGLALAGVGLGVLFSLLCAAGPLWWTRHVSPGRLFSSASLQRIEKKGWRGLGRRFSASPGVAARMLGGLLRGFAPDPTRGVAPGPHQGDNPPGPLKMMDKNNLAVLLVLLCTACAATGIALWSGEIRFGKLFAFGLGGTLLLAWILAKLSLQALRLLTPRQFYWKGAIHALLRRDEHYGTVLMALGLGLGLVMATLFLEDHLHQQLLSRLPQRMPSFFFVDIQPNQIELFQATAHPFAAPQSDAIRLFPTVRGRLLNAAQSVEENPDQPQSWRKAREYVLTATETIPTGNRLVAGEWWSSPTALEASVEVEMAQELGLKVGDSLSFDIQGITITARIANLRAVRWSDLGLNFFVIFSPAVLQEVPVTYLASVVAPTEQEEALLVAMTDRLHNVTAIATRTVLEGVQGLLHQLARAIRCLGGAAVVAGLLVLGVSVAASRRRRSHEMALYRLIGATRAEVARLAAAEFILLGGLSAGMGVCIGQVITALAVEGLLHEGWTGNLWLTLVAFAGGASMVFLTGWIGSYRELGRPILAVLHPHGRRN